MAAIRLCLVLIALCLGWLLATGILLTTLYLLYDLIFVLGLGRQALPVNLIAYLWAGLGVGGTLFHLILVTRIPLERLVALGFKRPVCPMPKAANIEPTLNALCLRDKLSPPKLWLVEHPQAFAFAASVGISDKSHVFLSTTMLTAVESRPEALWLIYQLGGQLHNRQCWSTGLWLGLQVSLQALANMFQQRLNLIMRVLNYLPLINLIAYMGFSIVQFLLWLSGRGHWVARTAFVILDLLINFALTIQADDFASRQVDSGGGRTLMARIHKGLEPRWHQFFATVPPLPFRLKRLEVCKH